MTMSKDGVDRSGLRIAGHKIRVEIDQDGEFSLELPFTADVTAATAKGRTFLSIRILEAN